MPDILLYRAIAQNNAMFLKLLVKHNPNLMSHIQQCDLVLQEYFPTPSFSFEALADGSDKRLQEIMDFPLYHEIITIMVQIYNAYCFNKFDYDQGVGICWGLLPTLIVSASANQDQLLENLLQAIRLTITMHQSHQNQYYSSGCLLTVEDCPQETFRQFLVSHQIEDTVLGVIYTDTNYIVSGSPDSLKIIMQDPDISSKCKYIHAVRYPLHNPHHNQVAPEMYYQVNSQLFKSTQFRFPVIDLETGADLTILDHQQLYLRMFQLFAVLPNDLNLHFVQRIQPDAKIFDLGCGGNNGIIKLLQKSLQDQNRSDCQLYNYQYDKCIKNIFV